MNGLDVLTAMRTQAPDVVVVMITAYGTVERAVQAMKQGAYDFVLKPFEPDHLTLIVQKALGGSASPARCTCSRTPWASAIAWSGGRARHAAGAGTGAAGGAGSATVLLLGKAAQAKNSLRTPSTPGVRARRSPFWPSTVWS